MHCLGISERDRENGEKARHAGGPSLLTRTEAVRARLPARLGHSKMTIDRQFETMMRAIINNLIH